MAVQAAHWNTYILIPGTLLRFPFGKAEVNWSQLGASYPESCKTQGLDPL